MKELKELGDFLIERFGIRRIGKKSLQRYCETRMIDEQEKQDPESNIYISAEKDIDQEKLNQAISDFYKGKGYKIKKSLSGFVVVKEGKWDEMITIMNYGDVLMIAKVNL